MSSGRWPTLGLVLACTLVSVSCISPCFLAGRTATAAPTPVPLPTVPASENAASRFEEKAQAFAGNTFRVEFTDEEVTSYVALNLSGSLPLRSPTIAFRPGTFTVEGDLTSPVRGHLVLTGTIQAADGKVQVAFQSAQVGGLAIPPAMLSSVSDTITQLILEQAAGVDIQEVQLLQGRIVIAGRRTAAP